MNGLAVFCLYQLYHEAGCSVLYRSVCYSDDVQTLNCLLKVCLHIPFLQFIVKVLSTDITNDIDYVGINICSMIFIVCFNRI